MCFVISVLNCGARWKVIRSSSSRSSYSYWGNQCVAKWFEIIINHKNWWIQFSWWHLRTISDLQSAGFCPIILWRPRMSVLMSFPSIQFTTFSVWTDMVDRHYIALVFYRIRLSLPMLLGGCLSFAVPSAPCCCPSISWHSECESPTTEHSQPG